MQCAIEIKMDSGSFQDLGIDTSVGGGGLDGDGGNLDREAKAGEEAVDGGVGANSSLY